MVVIDVVLVYGYVVFGEVVVLILCVEEVVYVFGGCVGVGFDDYFVCV